MSDANTNDRLREAARKRIKGRRSFWNMVVLFVIVAIILNAVWLLTSGIGSHYWPAWPMVGLGIAILFSAFGTFGPGSRPITDDAIDAEIRKMGGNQ